MTVVQPNLLLEGTDEASAQNDDESQETDVRHMPMLQENSMEDLTFLDPKVRAQAEWYHRTGEVLPTVQTVIGHGDAMSLPIDAVTDE